MSVLFPEFTVFRFWIRFTVGWVGAKEQGLFGGSLVLRVLGLFRVKGASSDRRLGSFSGCNIGA